MSFHGGFHGLRDCGAAVRAGSRGISNALARRCDVRRGSTIGLLLGRLANFINSELWGRPAPRETCPGAVVFPNGGPLPRHPSQLYEAGARRYRLCSSILALADPGRRAEKNPV
jgi:phosphatidylglycerol:prolipoprotein diacylglycerol transferase